MPSHRSPIWKIPKEEFLALVTNKANVKEIISSLGLKSTGGGNYQTVLARMEEEGIDIPAFKAKTDQTPVSITTSIFGDGEGFFVFTMSFETKNPKREGSPLLLPVVRSRPFLERRRTCFGPRSHQRSQQRPPKTEPSFPLPKLQQPDCHFFREKQKTQSTTKLVR